MWAEAIFSREDLARLVSQAMPLTIHLNDAHTEQSLALSDPSEVRLIPDVGLRVVCKAHVHWPVLGISVPITLNSLSVTFVPTIERVADSDGLLFRPSIEHADFAGLPAMVDDRLTRAINDKLSEKGIELAWNYAKTLSHIAPLPTMLDPLDGFALRPAWAKLRITEEALVYAVSFHSAILRRGEPLPSEFSASAPPPAGPGAAEKIEARASNGRLTQRRERNLEPTLGGDSTSLLITAGAFGLAAGATYFALRATFRER
jgi:hypothetical protein